MREMSINKVAPIGKDKAPDSEMKPIKAAPFGKQDTGLQDKKVPVREFQDQEVPDQEVPAREFQDQEVPARELQD